MKPRLADEPLALSTPPLLARKTFASDQRRVADLQNDLARRVFERTDQSHDAAAGQINRLLVAVRWGVLHLGQKEFASEAELVPRTYAALEGRIVSKHGRQHFDVPKRVLDAWKRLGIPEAVREQLLHLLHVREGGDIHAFYKRLRYEFGTSEFEKRGGITIGALWQREKTGVLPPYVEIHGLIDRLFTGESDDAKERRLRRHTEAAGVWSAELQKEYDRRGIEPPFAVLRLTLERHLGALGKGLTLENIVDEFAIPQEAAGAIIQMHLLPWEQVEPLAKKLFPKTLQRLGSAWKRTWNTDQERPTLERRLEGKLSSRRTLREFVYALQIRPPEERDATYTGKRKESYRPSSEIRRALRDGGYSSQSPIRCIIGLVAETPQEEQQLITVYRIEQQRHHKRTGKKFTGERQDLRIERDMNGVSLDDLAQALVESREERSSSAFRKARKRITDIENGVVRDEALAEGEVSALRKIVDRLGTERLQRCLARKRDGESIPEHLLDFQDVPSMVKNFAEAHHSFKRLSQRVRAAGTKWKFLLGEIRLRRIADGEDCLSLPLLRNLAEMCGLELPKKVEADWYLRFAEEPGRSQDFTYERPLARFLLTRAHALEVDMKTLCANRLDMHPGMLEKTMLRLEHEGSIEEADLIQLLDALEVKRRSVSHRFSQKLLDPDADLQRVLRSFRPEVTDIPEELRPIHFCGMRRAELEEAGILSKQRKRG